MLKIFLALMIGIFLGGTFGFFIAALLAASRKGDEQK